MEFLNQHLTRIYYRKCKIDSTYKSLRWQVFVGIFIGYAGYYIVRKNFSMAMPFLTDLPDLTGSTRIAEYRVVERGGLRSNT